MTDITVLVKQAQIPADQRQALSFLRRVARLAAREAGCQGPAEISLTLTTDQAIQALNRGYRGMDSPTDVLAFAQREFPGPPHALALLGDVVVSLETARRQAQTHGCTLERELAWLICHGVLHLLGFDHQTQAQMAQMRGREARVLQALKLGPLP